MWRLLPIALAVTGCGPAVLFRGEEPGLGTVYVVQEGGRRALRFGRPDAEDQSVFDPRRPETEPVGYVRAALVGLAHAPDRGRLLMIGLGGGSYLRHVSRLAPGLALEAVEISPLVVRLCRRYFQLPPRVQIHVEDGGRFVARTRERYALVFVDAYDAVDYPRHLGTPAFFRALRRVLAPGGVVVANLSPNTDRRRAELVRAFRAVFPGGPCLATPNDNWVLMGWGDPAPDGARARRRLRELERRSGGRYQLTGAAAERCY